MTKVIKLTKKLVACPSYVNKKNNEKKVGDFIFAYLKKIPYLKANKQFFDGKRFNIIARTEGKPKLLMAGHMDTVEPRGSSDLSVKLKDDKIFGLGALDTKGNVAAMLSCLDKFKRVSGLTLLFYGDEEYDFKGMKKFVENYNSNIGDMAVLAEPSKLKIWNAHRGLIEIYLRVRGKRGHSANPNSGRSAIDALMEALNNLKTELKQFSNSQLGESNLNIAYIRGGLKLDADGSELSRQGNNIPDFAEAIIEVRSASKNLNAVKIIKWIKKYIKNNQCVLEKYNIRHDFGALITSKKELKKIEKALLKIMGGFEYLEAKKKGYGDGEFLQRKFGAPVIYLGAEGANAHAEGEWVSCISLKKIENIYAQIIKKYCRYTAIAQRKEADNGERKKFS